MAAEVNHILNWYQGLEPKNVIYAVNCGSEESVTDVNGIVYQADRGYSDGKSSLDGYQRKKWIVPNTEVYQSERWHDDDFSYKVPIDTVKDHQLTLVLKFSEIYFDYPGQKVFDVKIGDQYVARDLDPILKAKGKYMPYDLFVDVVIRQGKVYIDNKESKGALTNEKGDKYLTVNFIKARADNPKVNAILVVNGPASNTHKQSFNNF